jgi:membrane associated rhomboid family serine protease
MFTLKKEIRSVRKTTAIFSAIALSLTAGSAMAYVGPGAGISVLGALWGLIIGVVMAVGVILFWPIRMLLRKRKAAKAEAAANEAGDSQQNSETS